MPTDTIIAICGALVAIFSFFSAALAVINKRRIDDVRRDVEVVSINVDGKLKALMDEKDLLSAARVLAALLRGRIEGHAEAESGSAADAGAAATAAAAEVAVAAEVAASAHKVAVAETAAKVQAVSDPAAPPPDPKEKKP